MHRLLTLLALLAVAGCTWPPGFAAPPLAPQATQPLEQTAERLPTVPLNEFPTVPRIQPPVPRIGGGGGLL